MKSTCSKSVGHDLVEVDAEHLVGPGHVEVEAVKAMLTANMDLGGEQLLALRVAVAEVADQGDEVAHGPLEAGLGELHHQVRPGQADVGDEGLGRAVTRSATSGRTMASPMSTTMAARLARRSPTWVPRSRSQPSTRGRLRVSPGS